MGSFHVYCNCITIGTWRLIVCFVCRFIRFLWRKKARAVKVAVRKKNVNWWSFACVQTWGLSWVIKDLEEETVRSNSYIIDCDSASLLVPIQSLPVDYGGLQTQICVPHPPSFLCLSVWGCSVHQKYKMLCRVVSVHTRFLRNMPVQDGSNLATSPLIYAHSDYQMETNQRILKAATVDFNCMCLRYYKDFPDVNIGP